MPAGLNARHLFIFSQMQTKMRAADGGYVVDFIAIRHAEQIDHHVLLPAHRFPVSFPNRGKRGKRHHRDVVGAGIQRLSRFITPGVTDLHVRDERQRRVTLPDFPDDRHSVFFDDARSDLYHVDVFFQFINQLKTTRPFQAIQSQLYFDDKPPPKEVGITPSFGYTPE